MRTVVHYGSDFCHDAEQLHLAVLFVLSLTREVNVLRAEMEHTKHFEKSAVFLPQYSFLRGIRHLTYLGF